MINDTVSVTVLGRPYWEGSFGHQIARDESTLLGRDAEAFQQHITARLSWKAPLP